MKKTRAIITVLFALVPIYGAYEWGWKFHDLLALYWFESLVFLADAMLKYWSTHRNYLVAKDGEEGKFESLSLVNSLRRKAKTSLVFVLVLLFFGVLHAAMLWNVFISDDNLNMGDPTNGAQKLFDYVVNSDLMLGILVSMGVRLLLYFFDFLLRSRHKTDAGAEALAMCVMRLFILHISLIVLGFIFDFFNPDAMYLLIAFVVFKALVDTGVGEMTGNSMKRGKTDHQ